MDIWFTEKQTPNVGITCKINNTLIVEQTPYQHLAIIDTEQFGRMLVLDGMVQTTIVDEFVYHEMIALVGLNTHPNPRRVLIIGGGDGGTLREVVKHPKVEKATMVEIDARVVEASKLYLPEISSALHGNPRAEVLIEDGIRYVKENKNTFDMIIVDSTEPVGPAVGLFSAEFYQSIFEALKDDGLFVAQTESPFFNADLIRRVYRDIAGIYPIAKLFLAYVPTYPSGMWSFTMGSKKYDPEAIVEENCPDLKSRYYTPAVHKAAFKLPQFVQNLLKTD
ncbi:MAG: polyamine aminopropyltransferase [Syntrophomonadaceae bacterium]|nr:polyamine aminopropyltransferase [Syntrophomonadaceae bacterium]